MMHTVWEVEKSPALQVTSKLNMYGRSKHNLTNLVLTSFTCQNINNLEGKYQENYELKQ